MSAETVCPRCNQRLPAGVSICPFCDTASTGAVTPAPDLPRVHDLRPLCRLGSGGMGEVCLYVDEHLRRLVAVKVLAPDLVLDDRARARFMREARAMAMLDHPHIVQIYEFTTTSDHRPCFIMEFVPGGTLRQRLKSGPLPLMEALRIVLQIIDALDFAWQKHIVHRDIKPSNILLDARNNVKVADFGLAKPVDIDTAVSLTSEAILGTPYYMAPEQARGRKVDFRADIYALGIVLYEMLTGHRPFAGQTPMDVIEQHLHTEVPDVRTLRPELPAEVAHLIRWMTAKDPEQRPASYAELRRAVEALLAGQPTDVPTAVVRSRPVLRPLIWVGVLLCFLGVWFWFRGMRSHPPLQRTGFVIAVAPFSGPDPESQREGRIVAAMIEDAVRREFPNAPVLGIETTGTAIRTPEEARRLGERLGATVVIWGETLVLAGETEIRPAFTLIPPAKRDTRSTPLQEVLSEGVLLAELQRYMAGFIEPVVITPVPGQTIAMHRMKAREIGQMVRLLAGAHALFYAQQPERALALLRRAPPSPERWWLEAEALVALRRAEEARQRLLEILRVRPQDAQVYARLGDVALLANDWSAAMQAFSAAADRGTYWYATQGIAYRDRLIVPERYRSRHLTGGQLLDTAYLLAIEPATGRVVQRWYVGMRPRRFHIEGDTLVVEGWSTRHAQHITVLRYRDGRWYGPLDFGDFLLRLQSMRCGWQLVDNLIDPLLGPGADLHIRLQPTRRPDPELPTDLDTLIAALRRAIARDPTQPWYRFFLGQALWQRGRYAEAQNVWDTIVRRDYPGVPYWEFAYMARLFEQFDHPRWADRIYRIALRKRRSMDWWIRWPDDRFHAWIMGIERLILTPFDRLSMALLEDTPPAVHRAALWLQRARELAGYAPELDVPMSALWVLSAARTAPSAEVHRQMELMRTLRRSSLFPLRMAMLADVGIVLGLAAWWVLGMWALIVLLQQVYSKTFAYVDAQRLQGIRRWLMAGILGGMSIPWLGVLGVVPASIPWTLILFGFPLLTVGVVTVVVFRYGWKWLRAIGDTDVRVMVCVLLIQWIAWGVVIYARADLDRHLSWPLLVYDSPGNPQAVRWARDTAHASRAHRYVAAVILHTAGYLEEARALYASLPDHLRARRNLKALERGQTPPPEGITLRDLLRTTPNRWQRMWTTLTQLISTAWQDVTQPRRRHRNTIGYMRSLATLWVVGWSGFALIGASVVVPIVRRRRHPAVPDAPAGTPATAPHWMFWLPGVGDILQGQRVRGLWILFGLGVTGCAAFLLRMYWIYPGPFTKQYAMAFIGRHIVSRGIPVHAFIQHVLPEWTVYIAVLLGWLVLTLGVWGTTVIVHAISGRSTVSAPSHGSASE